VENRHAEQRQYEKDELDRDQMLTE
jgi:hypothetical protein